MKCDVAEEDNFLVLEGENFVQPHIGKSVSLP